jgi:hypothetical protein
MHHFKIAFFAMLGVLTLCVACNRSRPQVSLWVGKAMGTHCGSVPNVCILSYGQLKAEEHDPNHMSNPAEAITVHIGDNCQTQCPQRVYITHNKHFQVKLKNDSPGTCPDNPFKASFPGESSSSGVDEYFDTDVPNSQAKAKCNYHLVTNECIHGSCPADPHIYIDQ